MQKNITIKFKEEKINIYGVLDDPGKTKKLVIFVHGITGHKNEHIFYNAAKFFNAKKYATFRFDLYSDLKNGRKLKNCSIGDHSKDLNEVVKFFKSKYKKIYLVGHSLGGPVVLSADLKLIEKIVLWDPSTRLRGRKDKSWYHFNKAINAYILEWSVSFIVGKKLMSEWNGLNYKGWFANCQRPLKVICAGDGILKNDWKKILPGFKTRTKLAIIKNAGHCFDENDTETILFNKTLRWIL